MCAPNSTAASKSGASCAGFARLHTPIATQTIAAVHREALTINDATAEVLLSVLRGRHDDRSWNNLNDDQRLIAMQLVAAGAITEEHGMLAPTEHVAYAFEPGQLLDSNADIRSPDR